MKKICFCIDTLGRGGAERVMSTLANMFSIDGYKVYFICNRYADEEYMLNAEVERVTLSDVLGLSKYNCIAKIQQTVFLRKFFKEKKIDIGISFMGGNNFALLVSSLLLPIKTIVSVRNDPAYEYRTILHKVMYNVLFPTADKIVFQTREEMQFFRKTIQRLGELIPNPTADRFYHNIDGGAGSDIVTVGRLVPQKNHKFLIEAFAEISANYPKTKLIIYGDGFLRDELKKYIRELNLEGRVILKGVVDNIETHIANAAAFVMCSHNEGMPNALMEAMALGLPVISTDCRGGGPAALIENGKDGLLLSNDNKYELTNAMKKILDSKEMRRSLARNAKEKAMTFHETVIYKKWKNLIEQL